MRGILPDATASDDAPGDDGAKASDDAAQGDDAATDTGTQAGDDASADVTPPPPPPPPADASSASDGLVCAGLGCIDVFDCAIFHPAEVGPCHFTQCVNLVCQ